VSNHGGGGLLPPRPLPGRPAAGQLADRSVRRCRSQANMPGAFTARSVRAPDGHTGCLSHRRGRHCPSAHARLLAGAGPQRSSLPLTKNNRGPVERLKAGTAGQLTDFCPLAAARALMCGAEGKPVLRHGAGQVLTALDSIPVTASLLRFGDPGGGDPAGVGARAGSGTSRSRCQQLTEPPPNLTVLPWLP